MLHRTVTLSVLLLCLALAGCKKPAPVQAQAARPAAQQPRPAPAPDPRDAEIARLREQLASAQHKVAFLEGKLSAAAERPQSAAPAAAPPERPASPPGRPASTPPAPPLNITPVAELTLGRLEVGHQGPFHAQDGLSFFFECRDIRGPEEMVVTATGYDRRNRKSDGVSLLIQGVRTAGVVDGKAVPLEGTFTITGTRRVPGRGTLFVAAPAR